MTSKNPSRHTRLVLLSGAALALLTFVSVPLVDPAALNAATYGQASSMLGPDGSFAPIVRQDKPAIVTITTVTAAQDQGQLHLQGNGQMPFNGQTPFDEFFRQFFGQQGIPGQGPGGLMPQPPQQMPQQEARALGSGFIISPDGKIVTNNHVIANADKITVTLDDGREFPARLVGTDPRTDLAVLSIDAGGSLPTVHWGDSDQIEVGDRVIAIGNPFGVGTTVTSGIVSARGRDLHNGPYDDFIQVDAAINHGNSGGALIDTAGEVVGITAAIYSPNDGNVGVGFAIPSDQAKGIVETLLKDGSVARGYLGVHIQPVSPDIAEAMGLDAGKGVLVADVSADSPAARAGLQAGDVVLAIDGTAVNDPKRLSILVAADQPGSVARFSVWRDGKPMDFTVTLASLPPDDQTASAPPAPQVQPDAGATSVPELGLSLSAVTPDLQSRFGLAPDDKGLVITSVDPGSAAADKGLNAGDVVQAINGTSVSTPAEAEAALKAGIAAGKANALILVSHQGEHHFLALPVAKT